jgi:hypothetical protein
LRERDGGQVAAGQIERREPHTGRAQYASLDLKDDIRAAGLCVAYLADGDAHQ